MNMPITPFLCIICLCVTSAFDIIRGPVSAGERQVFLDAPRARAVLGHRRVRRGWGESVHGATRGKENAERARQSMEFDREMEDLHRQVTCSIKCWGAWAVWSMCSFAEPSNVPVSSDACNSGTRSRTRVVQKPAGCENYPCPGSRVNNQTCHRNCNRGGQEQGDKCVCRDGFYGTCCQHAVTCPRPTDPSHGHLEGVVEWPALYKAGLAYVCQLGYALIGGPEVRWCQINGQWSGTEGRCQRIECPAPTVPEHGQVESSSEDYLYGTFVGFSCDLGYVLRGSNIRTCQVDDQGNGIWSGFQPQCIEKVCGDPGGLEHGSRYGDGLEFGDTLNFTCEPGYTMIGSPQRTCMYTGQWNGTQPVCQEVLCPTIEPAPYGHMTLTDTNTGVGSKLVFTCDEGYELDGPEELVCTGEGEWNGTVPLCQAIECPNPGRPEHGSRNDNGFSLGSQVEYTCFAGYVLKGAPTSQCLASRQWSEPQPMCEGCPKDHYTFEETTGERQCFPCPPNSHTVTPASISRFQCMCDTGYRGPHGGPCQEIQCPELEAPAHGSVLPCDRRLGASCVVECEEGYTLSSGASVRHCMEDGHWDGVDSVCTACPKNTFQASSASCLPCPIHSHTEGPGSTLTQCVCDQGYTASDGLCIDEDECDLGSDQCEQGCENFPGGYYCTCTVPGYEIDEQDGFSCKPEHQCRNLTREDAPENGGLVCHWYNDENSQQCSIKCNPGYEFSLRTNSYETCGPVTGYVWSFQRVDSDAVLMPCIEEFFPGFIFEAESTYFVTQCSNLNETQKEDVKRAFADQLNRDNVCLHGRNKICDIQNMGIICGYETRRKRRNADEADSDSTLGIQYSVAATKIAEKTVDCDTICPKIRIPPRFCQKYCVKAYKRYLRAGMMYAKRKVEQLQTRELEKITFQAAGHMFEPTGQGHVSDLMLDCKEGMMVKNGMCVPCAPGTYSSLPTQTQRLASEAVEAGQCEPCPQGWYQPRVQQTACIRCPAGSTSHTTGATRCQACERGSYGLGCESRCTCVNGDCDAATGTCTCLPGWTGTTCNIDIDGCVNHKCFQNVTCTDQPAPGSGFRCGACPHGYIGDGVICELNI